MTGLPGPLETAVLDALAGGPRLAVEVAEGLGHGIYVVSGMLQALRRRGLVIDEDRGMPPVRYWRLAEPRWAP